jgi:uncharacterized protein with von Willebrand factor type A (vWA) domain
MSGCFPPLPQPRRRRRRRHEDRLLRLQPVSAYWNGAATYYRGIIRALHERGHRVTFYEPDAYERQQHRDIEPPSWAEVVVYPATEDAALQQVEAARGSDLVVKASGVGVFDELLERACSSCRAPHARRLLGCRCARDAGARDDRKTIRFARSSRATTLVFTYGGGRR